ncbi:MAG TPA: NUDIX domain-containing protein [Paracoccaceae bacterium]|nr:NUDIX domain-containing protein [Paracoccaceae bacterium]
MPPIFLPSPPFDRGLVEIILGHALAENEGEPARIANPHARPGENATRPSEAAEGVLIDPAGTARDRLLWFMGTEVQPVSVETSTGLHDACGPAKDAAPLAELAAAPQPVAIEATREAIAHHGSASLARMRKLWPGIMIRAHMRARAKAMRIPAPQLGHGFGSDDVEVLEIRRPWTGYFALEEHVLRHRLFDGGWSEPVTRATFVTGDAATVLPYDPRTDRVLLIEQFRPAMFVRGDPNPWGIEAVAGRLDQEIDPEDCARREAREEAGLSLGRMEMIADYYTSPGFAAERVVSFIAEADLGDEGGLHGNPGEHEDIRAFTLGLDDALAGISSGEIDDAPAVLSLFWLQQNRARLRAKWG